MFAPIVLLIEMHSSNQYFVAADTVKQFVLKIGATFKEKRFIERVILLNHN